MREDDDMRLWVVVAAAGHLDCGSWRYDAVTDRLVCCCNARLFKAALVRAT